MGFTEKLWALLLLLPGCIYEPDSASLALCVEWNQAIAAYGRRCGATEEKIQAIYQHDVERCERVYRADAKAIRACEAKLEMAECGLSTVSCDGLKYLGGQ